MDGVGCVVGWMGWVAARGGCEVLQHRVNWMDCRMG